MTRLPVTLIHTLNLLATDMGLFPPLQSKLKALNADAFDKFRHLKLADVCRCCRFGPVCLQRDHNLTRSKMPAAYFTCSDAVCLLTACFPFNISLAGHLTYFQNSLFLLIMTLFQQSLLEKCCSYYATRKLRK